MARIPEEAIERVKREVSIAALVREAGVALSRHGASGDLAGRCCFHAEDETPSLVVTEAKGLWHCFGCGAGGDQIAWEMRRRGVGFREAAEALLERLAPAPVLSVTACPLGVEMTDRELALRVVDFYHETLKASPEALGYLERRGLESSELVERFRLGYSDRSLGTLLPEKTRVAGAELRRRLQALGLWRESGHEHLRGSLVVPIFEEAGGVAQMYGRKINDNLRTGTAKHLYLPGPLRGVWNWEALVASREVILCEALVDAMTFWCAGFRNVTAVWGVEGLTEDLLGAMREHGVERVLIAYDRDAAGDRGAEKHAERLTRELGIECFRVRFPRGMDANAYALSVRPAAAALEALVRGAEWMGGAAGGRGARPSIVAGELAPAGEADECAGAIVEAPTAVERESPPPLAARAAVPSESDRPEKAEPAAGGPLASPVPAGPGLEVPMEVSGEDYLFRFGLRRYRVRGLERATSLGRMAVHVLCWHERGVHADAVDLASARSRSQFAREAAAELGAKEETVRRELTRMFCRLEGVVEVRLRAALAPKAAGVELTEEEEAEALAFLRDPRLLERILEDFARCGVVGEETNKLVGYLAAVSRKLEEPLAVIIQSSSAAGKTSLMEAILRMVPGEERVKYSAVTGQSLFYMAEADLKHKVLALVEEEGAERASYALKLLQSEGELAIASTGKDPQTGRLVTHEYRVEGPVALMLTTTAAEIDDELQNRSIVLTVDEDREQTREIHREQREKRTLEGLWAREEREAIRRVHRNAQRLLRAVEITNPWARELTFLDSKTRTRRDHAKYLILIDTIALLFQFQREVKVDVRGGRTKRYIEVELSDIEVANKLAHEVLGRSLDELAPQTRRLLDAIERLVAEGCAREGMERTEYRFTQRAVREATGWSATAVKIHLGRLVDLEYVLVHRGGRGQQFVYELLYDGAGADGRPHLTGLIDVEALRRQGRGYDGEGSGAKAGWSGSGQGVVAVESGGGQDEQSAAIGSVESEMAASGGGEVENAHLEGEGDTSSSYPQPRRSRVAGGA